MARSVGTNGGTAGVRIGAGFFGGGEDFLDWPLRCLRCDKVDDEEDATTGVLDDDDEEAWKGVEGNLLDDDDDEEAWKGVEGNRCWKSSKSPDECSKKFVG